MRTLSVVTKATVSARWRGVSWSSGRPHSSMRPPAAGASPATARSRVLLPVPLRPMRAVSVPGASVAEASVSSVRLP